MSQEEVSDNRKDYGQKLRDRQTEKKLTQKLTERTTPVSWYKAFLSLYVTNENYKIDLLCIKRQQNTQRRR